jgi:hypothetical protein
MSADNRTVTTDALETLGQIITENEKRDAIHLAVEPVVAKEHLRPGDHVTAEGRFVSRHNAGKDGAVGIVDPFLTNPVEPGQRFWLVVYPRQIHSLRHVWTHPAFPDVPEVKEDVSRGWPEQREASEKWLRAFCESADCPGWDTVRAGLMGDLEDNDYGQAFSHDGAWITFHGRDAHGEIPDEFWDHVEIVTGEKFVRATSFNCSC